MDEVMIHLVVGVLFAWIKSTIEALISSHNGCKKEKENMGRPAMDLSSHVF
ncbi:hypothetical protein [Staphylococcus lutrae]|uniref:hypothetical protein n=1 Tax=Staphylococcus lutrae TaxID=155085 RepID=UPI00146CEE74|nr:hypothetical protein [Staphylococcus lutrae]